jgi:hypothetical protein
VSSATQYPGAAALAILMASLACAGRVVAAEAADPHPPVAMPHTASPSTEEPAQTLSPCAGLEAETPVLERIRDTVERGVCGSAAWVDSLFGVLPEDQLLESRRTHGRLRAGLNWDDRDGFGTEATLRAQVQMPLARQRMQLLFGRDTDEAFVEGGAREFDGATISPEDEDLSWVLGLGYQPIRGTRSRLGLGAGVRLRSPLDPYVQASYWFQTRLSEPLLFRARQTAFWEREDGFGTATRLSLERVLPGYRLLRWGNHLRIAEGTDGLRWNTNLTLYQALSNSRAVALRGAVRGETGREVNPIEYRLIAIHRRQFLRDWLFLELQAGGGWLREEPEERREFVPEARVLIEMSFGRTPRGGRPAAAAD